jgi:hypothetical protein
MRKIFFQDRKIVQGILLLGALAVLEGSTMVADYSAAQTAALEDPAAGPPFTIEKLPYDENEILYEVRKHPYKTGNSLFALQRSNSYPDFRGVQYVSDITDSTAKIHIDLPRTDFRDKAYRYFYVYMLNDQGGWDLKISWETYYYGPYDKRLEIPLTELKINAWQTVRVVQTVSHGGWGQDTYIDEDGTSDYNLTVARFKTNGTPPPPKSVSVNVTAQNGNTYTVKVGTFRRVTLSTPRIHSRIVSAKFYTDSSCTDLVGSSSTFKGSGYSLALNYDLPLGFHHFYATQTNNVGGTSPCSPVGATYQVVDCPEDYVLVQPDPAIGTPAFCLMATEARRGANDVAVPGFAEYPWETTPQEAKNACRRVGPNCDLVTNLEWMAAARQIEQYDYSNAHCGHVLSNLGVLNISDTSDEFDQISRKSYMYRRTFNLPEGTLWDFGGNLAEWADNAEVGGEIFQPITNTCDHGPFGLGSSDFVCPELDVRYYKPYRMTLHRQDTLASSFFVGRIIGPEPYDQYGGVPLAAARGGHHSDLYNSGIYSLFMFYHMDDTNGFRCVCHLPEE